MAKEDKKTFYVSDYIPIPPILHSVQNDGPFDKCIVCRRNLLEDDCTYFIEKAFRRDHVIVEYAMCLHCHNSTGDIISSESDQKLKQYWSQKVDRVDRRNKLLEKSKTDIEPWIEYCILTGTPRADAESYQICAQCNGPDMLFSYFPCIITEQAIEEMTALLSKQTKESLDDFTETYLGLGPEFSDVPNDFLMLL